MGVSNTHPSVHMNATQGTLDLQLLRHRCEVARHVCAEGLIINSGSVHRVFPEQVVVEGQMSQHDHNTTSQRERPVCIPTLEKLSVQIGQEVEVSAKFGNQCSRTLKPER